MQTTARQPRAGQQGFTYLELLVGIAALAVATVGLAVAEGSAYAERRQAEELRISQQVVEQLLAETAALGFQDLLSLGEREVERDGRTVTVAVSQVGTDLLRVQAEASPTSGGAPGFEASLLRGRW